MGPDLGRRRRGYGPGASLQKLNRHGLLPRSLPYRKTPGLWPTRLQRRQALFEFLVPLPADGDVPDNGRGPQDLAFVVFDQGDGELQGNPAAVFF